MVTVTGAPFTKKDSVESHSSGSTAGAAGGRNAEGRGTAEATAAVVDSSGATAGAERVAPADSRTWHQDTTT